MIIFRQRFIAPILAGGKTQTRRLWSRARVRAGGIYEARTYRAGKPFARLHVLDMRKERLGDISEEDAVREGYATSAPPLPGLIDVDRFPHFLPELSFIFLWCPLTFSCSLESPAFPDIPAAVRDIIRQSFELERVRSKECLVHETWILEPYHP